MSSDSPRIALAISPWPSLWSMQAGGAPTDYQAIAGLVRSGFTVQLIAPQLPNASAQTPVAPIEQLSIHRIPDVLAWRSFLDRWKVTGFAAQIIRYVLFQIVALIAARRISRTVNRIGLIYGLSALSAPAAWALKRLTGAPAVVRLFGTFLYPQLDSRWGLLKNFEETIAFKLPVDRLVITNDGTLGDKVAHRLGVPPERVIFWMNGVDRHPILAPTELRGRLGIQPETVCVLAASRLVRWKRLDRLIRVVPLVLQSSPAFQFIILGDGPERAALERMVDELGVGKNVSFQGAVSHDRVAEYLRAADIFVSVYDLSNVGNPLLEALASEKAIVTLDVGGTREVITHGVNGFLLAPEDDAALASALLEVGTHPALRRQLEQGARQYAEQHLMTWKERIDREQALIAELLSASNPSKHNVQADL